GKNLRSAPQLTPGFYQNPKSQIIHYVPEGKDPRATRGMNANRLQLRDPIEVVIESWKSMASILDVSPEVLNRPGAKSAVSQPSASKPVASAPARPARVNL